MSVAQLKDGALGIAAEFERLRKKKGANVVREAGEAEIVRLVLAANTGVEMVPWRAIDASPLNPRKVFDPEKVGELAESIAELGVKQNLLVRPRLDAPGRYWLIAGGRRHRAVGLLVEAGRLPDDVAVPARVERDCDDRRHLELSMIENLQRADMNPMEEAEGYAALVATGMSAGEIARQILGRPERTRYVQLRINLVDQLCAPCQEALREGRISVEQARVLKLSPAEEQEAHLECVLKGRYGYETTNGIRQRVRQEYVPVATLPDLREEYEARGGRIVADEEEALYASAVLVRELLDEWVERQRQELREVFPWVTVVRGYFSEYEYTTLFGHELAGAVIEVPGAFSAPKIHRALVKKSDLKKVQEGAEIDPSRGKPAADPWTKDHLAHARRRKSFAMRVAVGNDPDMAKRLVLMGLLGGGNRGVNLATGQWRGGLNKGSNPLMLVETIEGFGREACSCGLRVDEEGGVRPGATVDAEDLWGALCTLDGDRLDRVFAAAVALQVGTFSEWDPTPGDAPAAVAIARSLGLATAEEEYGLGMEPEDLEGLRKPALLAVARLAGVKVTDPEAMSARALREMLGGLPWDVRHHVVLPSLRFGAAREVVAAMSAAMGAP